MNDREKITQINRFCIQQLEKADRAITDRKEPDFNEGLWLAYHTIHKFIVTDEYPYVTQK